MEEPMNIDEIEAKEGAAVSEEPSSTGKRCLRKRTSSTASTSEPDSVKKHCSVKKKVTDNNLKEMKKIYLNKTVKKYTQNLETIFEEDSNHDEDSKNLIGNKKIRRSMIFNEGPKSTKYKINHRKNMVKRLDSAPGFHANRKKNNRIALQKFILMLTDSHNTEVTVPLCVTPEREEQEEVLTDTLDSPTLSKNMEKMNFAEVINSSSQDTQ